jgi:hypothetical protein
MENMSVVENFHILLYAHTVEYGINFDNNVEIHLTYRK